MNKINHLKSSFKKILKKIFLMREYRPIVNLDNKFQKRRIFNVIGGNLNPDRALPGVYGDFFGGFWEKSWEAQEEC